MRPSSRSSMRSGAPAPRPAGAPDPACPPSPTDWADSAARAAWIAAHPDCPYPEPVLAPIAPNPLTPADGQTVAAGEVPFAWNAPPYGARYYLEVCAAPDFGGTCRVGDQEAPTAEGPPGILTSKVALTPGTYYWRVRAGRSDLAGAWGPWSTPRRVAVAAATAVPMPQPAPSVVVVTPAPLPVPAPPAVVVASAPLPASPKGPSPWVYVGVGLGVGVLVAALWKIR